VRITRSKTASLRLDPLSYKSLRRQILRRDGWRCQSCGSMSILEVHHREFRSHSGADSEENLITLCTTCHAILHSLSREDNKRRRDGVPSQIVHASER
jgi:5-methylcytosine-specific restriction endonuclease McrA